MDKVDRPRTVIALQPRLGVRKRPRQRHLVRALFASLCLSGCVLIPPPDDVASENPFVVLGDAFVLRAQSAPFADNAQRTTQYAVEIVIYESGLALVRDGPIDARAFRFLRIDEAEVARIHKLVDASNLRGGDGWPGGGRALVDLFQVRTHGGKAVEVVAAELSPAHPEWQNLAGYPPSMIELDLALDELAAGVLEHGEVWEDAPVLIRAAPYSEG